MKRTKNIYVIISVILISAIILNFSGCMSSERIGNETADTELLNETEAQKSQNSTTTIVNIRTYKNMVDDYAPNPVQALVDLTSNNQAATDFAVRLFKASVTEGKNTLISPLSVSNTT